MTAKLPHSPVFARPEFVVISERHPNRRTHDSISHAEHSQSTLQDLFRQRNGRLAIDRPIEEQRKNLDRRGAQIPMARGTRATAVTAYGIYAEWIHGPETQPGRAFLYLSRRRLFPRLLRITQRIRFPYRQSLPLSSFSARISTCAGASFPSGFAGRPRRLQVPSGPGVSAPPNHCWRRISGWGLGSGVACDSAR